MNARSISIVSLVAQVLDLASRTKAWHSILTNVDDLRVKQIHFRLLAQQEISIRWASRMESGIFNGYEFGNGISHSREQEIRQLLDEMQTYYNLVKAVMEKILPAADGKLNKLVLVHRLKFASSGYEELLKLTDTLEAMNKALEAIAPSTPPSYFGNSNNASQGPANGYASLATRTPHEEAEIRSPEISIDNISQGLDVEATHVKISELFEQCLAGLTLMTKLATGRPLVATIQRHLETWGRDLFSGTSSIDKILVGPEESLRNTIIRALVFIAIIEEVLLTGAPNAPDDETHRCLSSQRSTTMALLGTGPLTEIASEYWPNISSDLHGDTDSPLRIEPESDVNLLESRSHWYTEVASDSKLHEDNKIVNIHDTGGPDDFYATQLRDLRTQTHELQSMVEISVDDSRPSDLSLEGQPEEEREDSNEDLIHQLYQAVELLFDILPGIRHIRQTSLLRQEELTAKLEKTKVKTSLARDMGESSRQRTLPRRDLTKRRSSESLMDDESLSSWKEPWKDSLPESEPYSRKSSLDLDIIRSAQKDVGKSLEGKYDHGVSTKAKKGRKAKPFSGRKVVYE